MKTMHEFRDWLFESGGEASMEQRRLASLTRLSPARLSGLASEGTWFIWHAGQ